MFKNISIFRKETRINLAMVFLGGVLVTLVSCATVQQSTRISSPLKSQEYNSMSSKYMDRPTWVFIERMSSGGTVLLIERDNYGKMENQIRFSQSHVQEYFTLFDKYFEWEKLATSRGDTFTKEIGMAKTWGNTVPGSLKFTFHSGNEGLHYLSISFCAAGTCLDDQSLIFNAKNVIELRKLLNQLYTGSIGTKNIDNIYR